MAVWAFGITLGLTQPVQACRLALMLGLDVSSSVNRDEYRLQRRGLARALSDPDIMDAIIGPPGAEVDLMIFEWSGRAYQKLVVDWTRIDSPETLYRLSAILENDFRASVKSLTSIGNAMLYAKAKFSERPGCASQTLDLSGDGQSNDGPDPAVVRLDLAASGITINALVIGTDTTSNGTIAELNAYFHQSVITGPYAFVETALGFEDYARAIKRKLLREIAYSIAFQRGAMVNRPS